MKLLRTNKISKKILLIISMFLFTMNNSLALENRKYIKRLIDDNYMKERSLGIRIEKDIEINLDEIGSIIEKNNLEIKTERLKVEQSKFLLKSAIASWYPNLSISSNGLPSYLDGYTYNSPNSSTNTLSRQLKTSLSTELKWDLINPLRKPEINSARDEFEKSKSSYLIKLRDIKLKAIKKYYLLQQAIEEVKIAKKSVSYSELSLSESQIKLNSGVGTKLELLEAKTQLSRDQKMLSNKIGNKKIRQRELTNILNLDSNKIAVIVSEPKIIGQWNSTIDKSIISAYMYRKELENILLDVSINNNKANTSAASTKPTISIYNKLDTNFNKGQALVSSPNMNNNSSIVNNTIGISATWKLIDGGKARSKYLYNKSKSKQAENNLKIKLADLREEVEKSFFNLKTEEKNILSTFNEVQTAKESLRLTKLRFKAGITTQREVVNQQRDLTEAKVNHIKSITNYNIHLSELSRQTGIDEIKSCVENNSQKENLNKSKFMNNLKSTNLLPTCK